MSVRRGTSAVYKITGPKLTTRSYSSTSAAMRNWMLRKYSPTWTTWRKLEDSPVYDVLPKTSRSGASRITTDMVIRAHESREFRASWAKRMLEVARQTSQPQLWTADRAHTWSRGHEYVSVTPTRVLSKEAIDALGDMGLNGLRLRSRLVLPQSYDVPLSFANRYELAANGSSLKYEDWRVWRQLVPEQDRPELLTFQRDNWDGKKPLSEGLTSQMALRLASNLVYPKLHDSVVIDGVLINSAVMEVSREHVLRGRAGWIDALDLSTGEYVGSVWGAGESSVPFVDGANDAMASPLWTLKHDKAVTVLEDPELRGLIRDGQLDPSFYTKLIERGGSELRTADRAMTVLDGFSFAVMAVNRRFETVDLTTGQLTLAEQFIDGPVTSSRDGTDVRIVELLDEDTLDVDSTFYEELPTYTPLPDSTGGDPNGGGGGIISGGGSLDGGGGDIHNGTDHTSSGTDPNHGGTTEPSGGGDGKDGKDGDGKDEGRGEHGE